MYEKHVVQRSIGSMSPSQFKKKVLHSYYSQQPSISGETLMNVTIKNGNNSGHSTEQDTSASHVVSADLEGVRNRYLVTGRLNGSIAIHDLHATTHQTTGPVTRKVFPTVLYIRARPSRYKNSVNRIEWYPVDFGHFSSSSTFADTVKIWDPNKGQMMEEFAFSCGEIEDHCGSPHQPVIAVTSREDVRLIDLRTGYTGQKFKRPEADLVRLSECCRKRARGSTALSVKVDSKSSEKRRKFSASDHKTKKQDSHSPHARTVESSSSTPALRSSSVDQSSTPSRSNRFDMEIQRRRSFLSPFSILHIAPPNSKDVSAVRFHPTISSALTAGYRDGDIVMWDVRSSRSYLFNLMDHFVEEPRPCEKLDDLSYLTALKKEVAGLRYSSDGRHLLSFTCDSVFLWDGFTGESLRHQTCCDISREVSDVQISTSSKCAFVSVGCDLASFDLESGAALSRSSGHLRPINGIVVDHSQHRLFSYGKDANFLTWNFNKTEPSSEPQRTEAPCSDVSVVQDGRREDDWNSDGGSDWSSDGGSD